MSKNKARKQKRNPNGVWGRRQFVERFRRYGFTEKESHRAYEAVLNTLLDAIHSHKGVYFPRVLRLDATIRPPRQYVNNLRQEREVIHFGEALSYRARVLVDDNEFGFIIGE